MDACQADGFFFYSDERNERGMGGFQVLASCSNAARRTERHGLTVVNTSSDPDFVRCEGR